MVNKMDIKQIIKEELEAVMSEENGEPGMSMDAAKAKVYTQYSPAKFLEELDNIDKQVMALRSGNPFKYSGATLKLHEMRGTIDHIRTAAELEMRNED